MPTSAKLGERTVWAYSADDAFWAELRESSRDNRLTLSCCGGRAVPVENEQNDYVPRYFRHAGKGRRICRRKELSPEYERLIPVLYRAAEAADWIVDADAREDEVFVDLLLTRKRSAVRVVFQVDLSYTKDRSREKVRAEWQRLALTNDFVFVVVRSNGGAQLPGVRVFLQPKTEDNQMGARAFHVLQQVERCYKLLGAWKLLEMGAPSVPILTVPRLIGWLPDEVSSPAALRVSPEAFEINLHALRDDAIAEWEEYLRGLEGRLVNAGIELRIDKPRYDWGKLRAQQADMARSAAAAFSTGSATASSALERVEELYPAAVERARLERKHGQRKYRT